jgi:3-oxoacyl-[acyl-carrier protein] reductase
MKSLTGKIALVTGASRGIGQAIAFALGEQGATILGTATTDAGAQEITQTLMTQGISGKGYTLDVSNRSTISMVIEEINRDFQSPLIVINNAGITRDTLLLRMTSDQWKQVIDTNLSGAFYVTQACLKGMLKQRWGRIVNISSVVGLMGNPGQANYVAAKAGMIGFTKATALEFATRGITANCIAPGFIETEMAAQLSESQQAAVLSRIPMGRMGSVADIAHAVLYLVSESSGYITGETLHVNGGMYMN